MVNDQQTLSLTLVDALTAAEDGAVDAAFVNMAGHAAAHLHGTADSRLLENWTRERRDAVARAAEAATRPTASAAEQLRQWLAVRPFDHDPRCQRLTVRLERALTSRYPSLFRDADAWLRRGFAPHIAVVHAIITSATDDADALMTWVESERDHLVHLMKRTGDDNEQRAAEAFYELRARHNFHMRILLGITSEHDVTRLEDGDALVAALVGAAWAGLEFEQHGLARNLVAFAWRHGEQHSVIERLARETQTSYAKEPAADAMTGERS